MQQIEPNRDLSSTRIGIYTWGRFDITLILSTLVLEMARFYVSMQRSEYRAFKGCAQRQ